MKHSGWFGYTSFLMNKIMSTIPTIAFYTLLEALRTRLLWLVLLMMLAVLGGSLFVQQLAITESSRFQTAFLAAALRPASVFILSLYIVSSMAREFSERGFELILSLDLTRTGYVLGKLAGYGALALALACLASLLLAWFVPAQQTALWGVSLLCELWIIAAFSLFCAMTFRQIMPAASLVLGFYLLARSMTAIQLIGRSALLDGTTLSHQFMLTMVNGIALALPRLDTFTQTVWLTEQNAHWALFAPIAIQTLIYCILLTAATLFDAYRKNY